MITIATWEPASFTRQQTYCNKNPETNLAKSQHKDLKIAVMKMFKHIKKEWNECPNEDWTYKQTIDETMEIVQEMKVEFNKEIGKLKETQTRIKLRKSNKNLTYSLEDMK